MLFGGEQSQRVINRLQTTSEQFTDLQNKDVQSFKIACIFFMLGQLKTVENIAEEDKEKVRLVLEKLQLQSLEMMIEQDRK